MILVILLRLSAGCRSYQDYIEVTNLNTQRTFRIKRGDYVQCRYRAFKDYALTVGGNVRTVTDSTLVYKPHYLSPAKAIRLADVQNIDRVTAARGILPAFLVGTVAGGIILLIGPKNTPVYAGLLGDAGTLFSLVYSFELDHRHLNRNKVGQTVRMRVGHPNSGASVPVPAPSAQPSSDTLDVYYQKRN